MTAKWDGESWPPAAGAHLLLLAVTLLPLVVAVPANLSIILHAALTVYIGSWRSVKQAPAPEQMSKKDAMRFPLVGSCMLVSMFLVFKYLPKELVNAVVGLYLVGLGTVVVVSVVLPFAKPLFPPTLRDKQLHLPNIPKIPFLLKEPIELEFTVPEAVLALPCSLIGVWYYVTKSWMANNILGLGFSLAGIEHLSVGSTQIAAILLSGLFFYDIFWVFCTPVMVTVAKNFEAPIKLLFPHGWPVHGVKRTASMLGLGDIVIPGLFVALMLRYDVEHKLRRGYFWSVFAGYVGGLVATIVVMNVFKAAQPALLYIVPAVLGAVALHAAIRGELGQVFGWSEPEAEPPAIVGTDAAPEPALDALPTGEAGAVATAEDKKGN